MGPVQRRRTIAHQRISPLIKAQADGRPLFGLLVGNGWWPISASAGEGCDPVSYENRRRTSDRRPDIKPSGKRAGQAEKRRQAQRKIHKIRSNGPVFARPQESFGPKSKGGT